MFEGTLTQNITMGVPWEALAVERACELACRLSASFLAVLDGLYVAHASGQEWDLETLAERFSRGVVAHVRRLERAT